MAEPQSLGLEAIAIDLDGTLVDSLPDLACAANYTLAQRGLAPLDESTVRGMIGDGIDTLLLRCLHRALGRDPETAELVAAIPEMREFYGSHVFEHSRVYPGVLVALEQWRERGIRLACVTNKASELTLPLLQGAGLDGYFEAVYCADTPAERKPAPVMLLRLLAELEIAPARCAMIGDSIHDIHAAQAAGILAIGVDYGYGDPGAGRDPPEQMLLSSLEHLRI